MTPENSPPPAEVSDSAENTKVQNDPATSADKEIAAEVAEDKKKGIVNKIIDAFITVVLLFSVALVSYIMICTASGKAVSIFGKTVLTVITGSMEPSIHEGDYITVEKTDPATLEVGDIISFYSRQEDIKGKLNTHRIIQKNDDGTFVTKGDANEIADPVAVRPEDILGKYTGRARIFTLISSFGNPRKLIMLFVIIPLVLVSLYEVKSLGKVIIEEKVEEKMSAAEMKEKLIREEIEKQKQKLREENKMSQEEVKPDEPRGDNEA